MSRHLKKYAAPTTWPILRKDNVYITKPSPGPHPLRSAISMDLVLRKLEYAHTKRDVKHLLSTNTILVDERPIKNTKFPIGIFDTLSLPTLNKHFRITFDKKGRLTLTPIQQNETKQKITKIIGKTTNKNNTHQINLSDGRNILTKEKYTVGDTLLIELPSQKIQNHLKLEPGAYIYLTNGKHITDQGTVNIITGKTITYTNKENQKIQTLTKYAYVIGKEKPLITLP